MAKKKKAVEKPLLPLSELIPMLCSNKEVARQYELRTSELEAEIKRHFTSGESESKEGVAIIKVVGAPIGKAKDELALKQFAQSLPSDFVEIVPESLSVRWDLIQNRPEMVKLAAESGIEIKQNISYRLKLEKQ